MAGLEIIVGSYQDCIIGFKVEPLETDPSQFNLRENFFSHVHSASVRALATNGKYLVSGGSDYRLCLFDLESGLHKDEMSHLAGTIEWLTFSPKGDLLFSGCFEGNVTAIRTNPLAIVKTWSNAHHGSVLSFSIHPEANIALSFGTEKSLKLWDLLTDRVHTVESLRDDANYHGHRVLVEWSPDGQFFALSGQVLVEIVSIDATKSSRMVRCFGTPVSLCWISKTQIAIGLCDGYLLIADVDQEVESRSIRVCETRLVALAFIDNYLATASEAGNICLWKLEGNDVTVVGVTTLGYTLTCMVMMDASKLEMHKYSEYKPEISKKESTIYDEQKVKVKDEDPLSDLSSIAIVPKTEMKGNVTRASMKIEDMTCTEDVKPLPSKISHQQQKQWLNISSSGNEPDKQVVTMYRRFSL